MVQFKSTEQKKRETTIVDYRLDTRVLIDLLSKGGLRSFGLENGTWIEYGLWVDRGRLIMTGMIRKGRITLSFEGASFTPTGTVSDVTDLKTFVNTTLERWDSSFLDELKNLIERD